MDGATNTDKKKSVARFVLIARNRISSCLETMLCQ